MNRTSTLNTHKITYVQNCVTTCDGSIRVTVTATTTGNADIIYIEHAETIAIFVTYEKYCNGAAIASNLSTLLINKPEPLIKSKKT